MKKMKGFPFKFMGMFYNMICSDSDIEQAHDDDTECFYFGFHLNQNIKLLKLKKNFISTNKKAPVRRLFEKPRYWAGL